MDAWTSPGSGSEPARAADREAVRVAEQALNDAWIGRLLLAESETKAVATSCADIRKRAAERVRAAEQADDLAGLAQAQTELDLAEIALNTAEKTHELADTMLARELGTWSQATALRAREALSDRSGANRQ